MENQSCLPSECVKGLRDQVWNKGYWDGYTLKEKSNPYPAGEYLWKAYEAGYEEGWLDS